MKITLEEWIKLSKKEKGIRYKDLSDHDKFLVRIGGTSGGVGADMPNRELTEEEKMINKEIYDTIMEIENKSNKHN